MTVEEVQLELGKLRNEFPVKANFSIRIELDHVQITVWPRSILGDESVSGRGYGSDFAEAFAYVRKQWSDRKERHEAETIRTMALAIIRITADRGQCDAFSLRADKFSQADIDEFGSRAVEDANKIAAGGPFSIVSSLSNAA